MGSPAGGRKRKFPPKADGGQGVIGGRGLAFVAYAWRAYPVIVTVMTLAVLVCVIVLVDASWRATLRSVTVLVIALTHFYFSHLCGGRRCIASPQFLHRIIAAMLLFLSLDWFHRVRRGGGRSVASPAQVGGA